MESRVISIYQLKPRFQNLLRPLVQTLFDRSITANQVTLAAAAISVVLGLVLSVAVSQLWLFALVPLWMIVRMALNAIDGMLAREFGQQSKLGAYLNELCDVIADAALFLPFALLPGVSPLLVVLLVLLAVISEYAGVLGPMVGASRRYDGPMGKSDRAFCFGVIGAGVATSLLPLSWINPILILINLLLLYTLYNRVRRGLAETESSISAE
jgi:CDP-diacylglycerol--glycerol-3-phosphate 3-phosphatidyltransferase